VSEIIWLSRDAIEIMHAEQLAEHGGLPGIRDGNALLSALARPLNKASCGETDVFALAAAYLVGLEHVAQKWEPVLGNNMRKYKNLERGSDSIRTQSALAKNHPFSDGNKRIAYLAGFTFLYLNGFIIEAAQMEIVAFVLAVAAGEIDENGAAHFLKDHSVPT
jgi:death-on-curing protein